MAIILYEGLREVLWRITILTSAVRLAGQAILAEPDLQQAGASPVALAFETAASWAAPTHQPLDL